MRPFVALPALFCVAALVARVVAAPGDVAGSFDAPCKYPAGVASDGTSLYVLDWRNAQVNELDPETGDARNTWNAPTLKPHGLTCGNGLLYISDDHGGGIFAFNPETGIVENTFSAPGRRATGLAWADDTLYVLERGSRKVYQVVPEDGTILANFDLPDNNCTCLAFDGTYLWLSNRVDDEIYMVRPEDGTVVNILDAPGPFVTGVTWHDGMLHAADFQTRKVYQIKVHDAPGYALSEPREARCEYYWDLANYGPADVRDLVVSLGEPVELPYQKLLSDVEFSREPTRRVTDRWGQGCAIFNIGEVPAGQKAPVSFRVRARISAIRYFIVPEKCGTLDDIPAEIREAYLVDGERYRINSAFIRETARKIVGEERNPYWIARRIFNHIIGELEYEMVGGWDVPEVVLKRGSGSCSEYTFCFIALCRAAGLPARYQGSVVVRGDEASIDEAFHRWAQVYLPHYGWVPVDANAGDKRSPADQARGFGELANRFLITTQGGGDSEYLRWGYNSHATYKTTGFARIEQDNIGFWEPLSDEPTAAQQAFRRGMVRPIGTCQPTP